MIAGGGFAVMAWREAQRRTYKLNNYWPFTREWCLHRPSTATAEYYRICDRAWEAWHEPQLLSIADAGIPVTVRL